MAADPRGWTWVAGNHCPLADNHLFTSQGLCHDPSSQGPLATFAPVWVSKDGGRTYRFVADPLATVKAAAAESPGGEDTDVVVQPAARAGRPPLLYVVSAWALSATLAISGDDGASWRLADITAAPFTAAGIDRPWLAASGTCDLFLQYHPLSGSQNLAAAPRVDHFDGCALFDTAAAGEVAATPLSSTSVEPPAEQLNGVQVMGKLVASAGRVFLAYLACDVVPETNLNCNGSADHQGLHIATSSDAGASWQDQLLPDAALRVPLNDGVWPMSMGADGPNLAVAVTDTQHVHLWTSGDAGRSWRLHPRPLDAPLGWNLATVPSVAVRGALVSVAWYGSGPAAGASQEWHLVLARSSDSGAAFAVTPLDPVLAATPSGTPLGDFLYDDFGALVTADGATLLTYTQSCSGKPATDPVCPGPPTSDAQGTYEVVRYARIEAVADRRRGSVPAVPSPQYLPNTSR
ncbi:MAG: WD40/YVTN/BNR-like repeat-containing protein [Candidatus Dormibacteria bacterium]